jgi:hypothetical protein
MFGAGTGLAPVPPTASVFAMPDDKPAGPQPQSLRGDAARQDRLKAKLRENLKRRKSQLRQREHVSLERHQDCPDGEVGKTDA